MYEAFIESELDVPKHLARRVHEFYFNPQYDEFKARTLWSLSNAFRSAFKELGADPAVQSDRQAERLPGATVLAEVLKRRLLYSCRIGDTRKCSIPSSPPRFSKALRARSRNLPAVSTRSDVRDRLTALQDETAAVRRSLERRSARALTVNWPALKARVEYTGGAFLL